MVLLINEKIFGIFLPLPEKLEKNAYISQLFLLDKLVSGQGL
jgi:hypothetical protein